mmetsp:Transcript_3639/g.6489  ORF Transcript_3639/g.6489 Transcript_3639/m.6489 type:complete len:361 (+) Transcript_3639:74-1156(+)
MHNNEEVESCIICQDAILKHPTAALRCGHVYHRDCIASWLVQCKDSWKPCPQCKKLTTEKQVRQLDYEVVELPPSLEDVLHDLRATRAERRSRKIALRNEWRAACRDLRRQAEEARRANEEASACKAERLKIEEATKVAEDTIKELAAVMQEEMRKRQGVTSYLDQQNERQLNQLPIKPVADGDPDVLEERKKLRNGPAERVRVLHKALLSAMVQEQQALGIAKERKAAAAQAEEERRLLQEEVASMELRLHRLGRRSQGSQEEASQDAISLSALKREAPRRKPAAEAPAAPAKAPKAQAEEDDIFGGPAKLRRKTSGRFGLAPAAPVGPAALPTPAKVAPPALRREKSSTLKTLFSQIR